MLSAEIAALRRIGSALDFDGGRMAFAFGCSFDDPMPCQDYNFEFSLDGDALVCVIDIYSALGFRDGQFDVDAWEAAKIRLRAAPTRDAYHALASVARAVLKGLAVELPDGTTLHIKELAQ